EEGGTCSLYEFIHSFRNSPDDEFPNPLSQESINALKMMKTIMTEVSSDEQFKFNEKENEVMLFTDNFVFAKFWYTPYIPLISGNYVSLLPGVKPGITGSIIGSNNLAINKYIKDEKRKKAAAEVIKYFASEAFQKVITTEFGLYSGITKIYEDVEVCKKIDCEFFKSLQPIARPIFELDDYSQFTAEFRKSIYSYLYGDNTPEKALQQVIDITKYYYVTAKKFKWYFSFLSKPLWMIIHCGNITILIGTFIEYGEINSFKCTLKVFVIAITVYINIIGNIIFVLINNADIEDYIIHFFSRIVFPLIKKTEGAESNRSFLKNNVNMNQETITKSKTSVNINTINVVNTNANISNQEDSKFSNSKDNMSSNSKNIANKLIQYHFRISRVSSDSIVKINTSNINTSETT
ncbi:hypothetical protein PIROE2DRAFT_6915, partial [Piromyces sp. E2]